MLIKSAVTEPESRAPSTTIRQDLCHGAGVHGRHKGWFSEFRTEQSQKIRQPVASLLETTPQKGPPRQAEAAARRHSQGKVVSLQVPCATPSSNFWELEVCDFCDISPPPRQADAGAPPPGGGDRPPEERLCWGGLGESRPAALPRGRPSPTSACRCPAAPCSWGSSGPRPAGHPRRRG